MKRIAKITVALLLAVAMCFSLAGCYDEDLNWSAKYDDTELPAGAYIYYLSIAYNEAASKVSTEDEVLKSEIDGTPAETWIKNRADEYVNQYLKSSALQKPPLTLRIPSITECTSRSSTRCTARAAKTKCRKASCASTLRTITTTTSISLRR